MTKPTTIKAITEIPANTPKPIGKTWSFLPGKTNGVAEELAAFSAAAVALAEPETVDDPSAPIAEIATAPAVVTELSAAELAVTEAEEVAEAAAETATDVVSYTKSVIVSFCFVVTWLHHIRNSPPPKRPDFPKLQQQLGKRRSLRLQQLMSS